MPCYWILLNDSNHWLSKRPVRKTCPFIFKCAKPTIIILKKVD